MRPLLLIPLLLAACGPEFPDCQTLDEYGCVTMCCSAPRVDAGDNGCSVFDSENNEFECHTEIGCGFLAANLALACPYEQIHPECSATDRFDGLCQ